MSKLEELRDRIEKKGYSIQSGHWDGSGITMTLFGKEEEIAFYISQSDEDFLKVFHYIGELYEKMRASQIGSQKSS